MFLVDDILLAPLNGMVWLGKKINEIIQKEQSDEGKIKEELMKSQLQFELDEISEEQYTKQEKELLERLDSIRKMKEEE
ncbi:gas vesicle protein GvpG [Patescibacteria group bacterium]|nr:gas vesicle protein GvpG [Patescibacteria group bacterium]